jgi:pyruvate kinase
MLKLVDGVIIARSSIAMVLPLEDVSNTLQAYFARDLTSFQIAHVQKSTIRKCNFAGKPGKALHPTDDNCFHINATQLS